MNPVKILGSQLLDAKKRYEDTGGVSQTLGYYMSMNYDGDTEIRFKNTALSAITLPAEHKNVFVMRLSKVGTKVKAKAFKIGMLFKSIDAYNDKYYLRDNI
jgi:hypothetical protein